ncbi:Synaptotagmin-C [Aphelenchoides besseyi]|nr:Synaptotagmin-C [Aphelenchoides besseyi]KAI6202228.1 Synaptotagmin-C [Aphelenchoides besseyi]
MPLLRFPRKSPLEVDAPGPPFFQRSESSGLFARIREFLDSIDQLKRLTTDKWPTTTIVGIIAIFFLILLLLIVIFTCFLRRMWRFGKRIRRKSRLRNFDKTKSLRDDPSAIDRLLIRNTSPNPKPRFTTGRVFELPLQNGSSIPQIRVNVSSVGRVTPDRPFSSMSNSSAMPPWTESRSSIATTISHMVPGSPASFNSHEPLRSTISSNADDRTQHSHSNCSSPPLQLPSTSASIHTLGSFWQRVAKRHLRFSQQVERQRLLAQVQQQFLLGPEIPYHGDSIMVRTTENGHDDDRDIDERSVAHYELGTYDKMSTCFRGTLTYQLRYDFIHRVLMLHVIRATNLPISDGPPDSYIKMYCLPERRHHCKTSIFKKSVDPEINEMFSFDVLYNQLPNRMLQFTVYDFDRFTRHGLIGNVIMRDLFDKSDLCQWTEFTMQIVGNQEKNDFGDLLLYLAYSVQLKKLYVTVSKAYNLRPMDITGASDPYVKVELIYQRRRVKLRKTSIKRANLNPVYKECLEFDLLPSQVHEANLLVQVMDWDRIGRDDLLGCCIIGRESPTKDGRQQWEQCFAGVRGTDGVPLLSHSVSCAVTTTDRQELDDAYQQFDSLTVTGDTTNHSSSELCNGALCQTDEMDRLTPAYRSLENGCGSKSAPPTAKISTVSAINMENNMAEGMMPVAKWHSLLEDLPEAFKNIPKAKKK